MLRAEQLDSRGRKIGLRAYSNAYARAWAPANFAIREDGCWEWLGGRTNEGYGRWGSELAHRRMYRFDIGPIPDGLQLDHLCRFRACVNPAHLEVVTNQENARRGRALRSHCPQGHAYDDANTYVQVFANGARSRRCRRCERDRKRRDYQRKRAMA